MSAYKSRYSEVKVLVLRETTVEWHANSPQGIADYWNGEVVKAAWYNPSQEAMVVMVLNSKMRITAHSLVTLGLVNQTLCHAREVFCAAVAMRAACIVLAHNHPSNDPTPSADDIRCTKELVNSGKILGIDVVDHVIVGEMSSANPRGWYSLKEAGLLME